MKQYIAHDSDDLREQILPLERVAVVEHSGADSEHLRLPALLVAGREPGVVEIVELFVYIR